jgi:hypothetical protein
LSDHLIRTFEIRGATDFLSKASSLVIDVAAATEAKALQKEIEEVHRRAPQTKPSGESSPSEATP